jgi:hypothetical protein
MIINKKHLVKIKINCLILQWNKKKNPLILWAAQLKLKIKQTRVISL